MSAARPTRLQRQEGVMLLEALIAILIFSLGILAVVGMQAAAVRTVADSRDRSEAAFLANQLMSQIWTDAGDPSVYAWDGTGTAPTRLTTWFARVQSRLPGTDVVRPVVTVTGGTALGGRVQIQLFWRSPEEAARGVPAHQHLIVADVFRN